MVCLKTQIILMCLERVPDQQTNGYDAEVNWSQMMVDLFF